MSQINITVALELFTCTQCGCSYGVVAQLYQHECPSCAKRARTEVATTLDRVYARGRELERTIAGLKGALAKKRKGTS